MAGMANGEIIDSMRIDLTDDELQHLIRAVEHYDAYLLSQNRPEVAYAELLKALKRLEGWGGARESY